MARGLCEPRPKTLPASLDGNCVAIGRSGANAVTDETDGTNVAPCSAPDPPSEPHATGCDGGLLPSGGPLQMAGGPPSLAPPIAGSDQLIPGVERVTGHSSLGYWSCHGAAQHFPVGLDSWLIVETLFLDDMPIST